MQMLNWDTCSSTVLIKKNNCEFRCIMRLYQRCSEAESNKMVVGWKATLIVVWSLFSDGTGHWDPLHRHQRNTKETQPSLDTMADFALQRENDKNEWLSLSKASLTLDLKNEVLKAFKMKLLVPVVRLWTDHLKLIRWRHTCKSNFE